MNTHIAQFRHQGSLSASGRAIAALTAVISFVSGHPASAVDEIAKQSLQVLTKHCGDCHGKVNPVEDLSILDHRQLMESGLVGDTINDSEIWNRIVSENADYQMPPGAPMPDADQQVIRRWIEAGTPEFVATTQDREIVLARDVYKAIAADLETLPRENRNDVRYFSLTHLHNHPSVTEHDLELFRAAFVKLLNSLSWKADLFHPVAVDFSQSLYRLDLAELDWDLGDQWQTILAQYPYGISQSNSEFGEIADRVYAETGTDIPVIRMDWFVATASQPELYQKLLKLPTTQRELEAMLGVHRERDFQKNRQLNAGMTKSNVSTSNRQVERHPSNFGYYWLSHDFKSSSGNASLLTHPLGPEFDGNAFSRHAFDHDGGEIIFSLPNGLQGYLIVDGEGNRIDVAPTLVVFNRKETLGRIEVLNGVSCIACHVSGMQSFQDDVLLNHGLSGAAKRKVELLYPPRETMNMQIALDRQRFMNALEMTISRYFPPSIGGENDLASMVEPVAAIARQYTRELGWADLIAEIRNDANESLRLRIDAESLKDAFRNSRKLRSFGLSVVANGGVISRNAWHTAPNGSGAYSMFQEVMSELSSGSPVTVFE